MGATVAPALATPMASIRIIVGGYFVKVGWLMISLCCTQCAARGSNLDQKFQD